MLKVLVDIATVYLVIGVSTAVMMLVAWAYYRCAAAYRHMRDEMPAMWEVILFSTLCWPLVVYLAVTGIARLRRTHR